MVETRSQRKKKQVEMVAESPTESSHDVKDTTIGFNEKVLEKVEEMETSWDKRMDLFAKEQEAYSKVKEELDELRTQHDELRTQYEYTDLMCTQLAIRVKEVEESRDEGLAEIVNLKKTLEDTKNELAIVKKAMGHNSGGGVTQQIVTVIQSVSLLCHGSKIIIPMLSELAK